MSKTVDQRVVEMQFDNKHFESNVATSMSTLDKLKQSLNLSGASKGLENIGSAAKNVDMSSLSGAAHNLESKFSALEVVAIGALMRIGSMAVSVGQKIASALIIDPIKMGFQEYELKMGSIQTIMAGTGEDLSTVNNYLEELNRYADQTIYSFSDMTSNIGKFTNAGVGLKDAVNAIKGVSNVAAVSGANSAEASRAMYNFAQALSAGYVKLIDWKSIENANMATKEFKEELLETGLALGTVVKIGDKYRTTTKDNLGKTSDLFDSTSNFNEALKAQWMTTDVLVQTLNRYSDETTDIGKKAYAAAQDIKTFTQLFSVLQETAQSGWAMSWEYIVGDFEEAKALLSEINEVIGGMIGASADERNKVLFEGLSTGWKQLLKQGISDEEAFKESVMNVAKDHGIAIDQMIEDSGSFEKTLKDGWLTADLLSESIEKFTIKVGDMSEEELEAAGYTREQVEELKALDKAVKDGSLSISDFSDKIAKMSGRENLIQALRNAFEGVMSVVTPFTEAFREIFPPITAQQLYNFTETLKNLTSRLKLSETASANLKSTFRGLFAVLDIVRQAFSAIFKAVSPLFGKLTNLGGGILGVTGSFGEWLVRLNETIKTTGAFNKAVQKVVDFIGSAVEAVKSFVQVIKEKLVFPGFEIFHAFLKRIHSLMSNVGEAAGSLGSEVVAAISAIGKSLANSKFINVLEALWSGIKVIFEGIANAFRYLTDGLTNILVNTDFSGLLFNIVSISGIAITLSKFIDWVKESFDGFGGILEKVTDVLDNVLDCLKAYQTQLKAGALLKIAVAIGVLAAAILVISLIDSKKLAASLGAITVLFADLMGSMALFNKVSDGLKGTTKACTAMIAISVAVLILATALKKIGDLDPESTITGLIGIASLMTMLVGAAQILGKSSAKTIKGAAQMIIFATAIKKLASVCEDLSKLSWNELAKGLAGVGVLLAEVSIFLNTAKFSGKSITTATGIVILSAAIKILASACDDFGKMSWGEIGKGLASIAILLTEITAFTKLTGNASKVVSTGLALIAIGAAMKIFASAVKDFSGMQWDELTRGLTGMAGVLIAVTTAVNYMPKNMIGLGVGLIAVSAALVILADALGKMGGMSWEEITRGLTALGGSIIILSVGLNAMNGTQSGSAALLIAAGALAILAPTLSILGAMSWEGIVKGLVSIAGAFTVIGVAGLLLKPLAGTIVKLAGAFALIGVGVLAIGVGLLAAGAGLSAIALAISTLAAGGVAAATAIVASLKIIITGVISLIPAVMEQIGKGIVAICGVIADGVPAIGEAIMAVILTLVEVLVKCVPAIADGALQLVVGVLAALVAYTPTIVDYIFEFLIAILEGVARNLPALIQAIIDVLMALFSGVIEALKGVDPEVLIQGIAGIGLLSAIMIALAAVSALTPAAMLGVVGMGLVIAELALVLAAVGALAQIPGLLWLVGEGGKLMQGVGTAIGQFVGGIVGGFMSGISSQFPQIGKDLSDFMVNIQPFIDGARHIDASAFDGVKALAETILLLTAANVIEGLTSWITGGSSLASFGTELASFGPHFKAYYDSIKGVDGSVVELSANAAKALAEFASEIPNSGGLVSWFTGENSLSKFADELIIFGPKLKQYADSVKGLDSDVVTNSANAAKALAGFAVELPNSGGMISWFVGDNSLSKFAEELVVFGPNLKKYADSVAGLDADVVVNSANAAKALTEFATEIPNSGGLLGWFVGENDIDAFGTRLVSFGKNLKQYALGVAGLDVGVVTNSTSAAQAVSELAANLPDSGGIVSWFTGDNNIAEFGENVVSFGKNFSAYSEHMKNVDNGVVTATLSAATSIVELQKSLPEDGLFSSEMSLEDFGEDVTAFGKEILEYYNQIKGISASKLSVVTKETNELIKMAKGMAGIDSKAVSSFGSALTSLGKAGVDGFISAFTNATSRVKTTATNLLTTFTTAVNSKSTQFTNTFTKLVTDALKAITNKKTEFKNAGQTLLENLGDGAKGRLSTTNNTFAEIITKLLGSIRDKYADFKTAGQTLVDKVNTGATDKRPIILKTFTNLAKDCLEEVKKKKDDFKSAGNYVVKGFGDGITAYTWYAKAKAKAMANAAYKAAMEALDAASPSKVFMKVGSYVPLGFALGISQGEDGVEKSSTSMAQLALSNTMSAVSKMADYIADSIDAEPTIRPVLDLTNVSSNARKIDDMLDMNRSIALAGQTSFGFNMSVARSQNGITVDNDDVVDAIGSLRKDVSSLASVVGNLKVIMDTGALVGSLTNPLNASLGRQAIYEKRGN